MMLRMKIWFTILAIYEIVAIILLHCMRTCDAMFGTMFCNDHAFKYFIWCVAVPLLAVISGMWIREIIVGGRRRRFMHRAGRTMRHVFGEVKERVIENVSPQDVEGLITAAVILGMKKLSDRYPNASGAVRRAMGGMDDMSDTENNASARASSSRTSQARASLARSSAAMKNRRRK